MPKTTSYPSAVEQDVWAISEDPRANLGEKVVTPDGREYRYAKNGGTALNPGQLIIAADAVSNHDNLAVNTAEVGDTTLTVTLGATAVTANQYVGGYAVVNDDTGEGIAYKIIAHPTSDGSEAIAITLEDPIKVAFADATTVTLIANKYSGLIISDGTQTDTPVGVPNVAVTADYYFWVQTKGLCPVLVDGSTQPTPGQPVTIGNATSGAVEVKNAVGEPTVGQALKGQTYTAGEYEPVYLSLE